MARVITGSEVMYAKGTPPVKPDQILNYIKAVETVMKIPFVQTVLARIIMKLTGGQNQPPAPPTQNLLLTSDNKLNLTPEAVTPAKPKNNGGMSPSHVYNMLLKSKNQIVSVAGEMSVAQFFQQIEQYPDAAKTIIEEGMKNADKPKLELAKPKVLDHGNTGKRKDSAKPAHRPAS